MNSTAWINKATSPKQPATRLITSKSQKKPDLNHISETKTNVNGSERNLVGRRITKYERKPLGDPNTFIRELSRKPILTPRDKEVLLSIYHHKCLTTSQITEMHFKQRKSDPTTENQQAAVVARRRLRKLFDYQLIDHFFVDVGKGNGSSQAHIMLDHLGAKVVAGLLNCKVPELNWRYEMNEYRLPYVQHMIDVNDFYLQLLRNAREHGHEVGDFRTENLTRHEFVHWGSKVVFNPDAYGQYFTGSDGIHFFLEWDRDTMSIPVFQKKQQRYAAYYASDEYKKLYDTFPLVLTVAPSWDRALKLRNCIYAVDETDIVWLFPSRELFDKAGLLSPIWIGKDDQTVPCI